MVSNFRYLFVALIFISCQNSGKKVTKPKQTSTAVFEIKSIPFSNTTQARFAYYWDQLHLRTHYSGVTLLADKDSIYTWTAGLADSNKILNTEMPMQIASISKTFCATATMILYSQGKIKLSDSLRKYFPQLPYYGITIEHLLSHSSGLPEYTWFCDEYKDSFDGILNNSKLLEIMAKYKPEMYFVPGQRHRYTNTNFVLMASIIEKISGITYSQFLQKNIFHVLGMKNTRVMSIADSVQNLEVKGHYGNGAVYLSHYQDGTYGDKNIISTVWDLYRFFKGISENKLFPETIRNEMFRTRWPNARRGTAYALGWRKRTELDETWMFHSGWWHGFRTNFYCNFSENKCAITLSNRLSGGFIPGKTIVSIFHPEIWDDIIKAWDFAPKPTVTSED